MKKLSDYLLRSVCYIAAALVFLTAFLIIGYIIVKGIPNLSPGLFEWKYTSENASLMPAVINTAIMSALSLLIAVPLGVGSAVYLVEYASRGNRLVMIVRLTTETLSGLPSIVYGLFGYLFFLVALGWDYSMMSGAITLAIMILPLIMRSTEEALIAIPDSYREGSFGLGAGKLRTVARILLPSAIPGILSGVILAIGRIVGESAALIFTAGTVAKAQFNLMGSGRTLAVHMYVLSSEGLHIGEAYGTALVLLVMTALINALSGWIARRISGGKTA